MERTRRRPNCGWTGWTGARGLNTNRVELNKRGWRGDWKGEALEDWPTSQNAFVALIDSVAVSIRDGWPYQNG